MCEGDTLSNFRVCAGETGFYDLLELYPESPESEVLVGAIFSPFFILIPSNWPDAVRCHC